MIRARSGGPVTITRYNGNTSPATFTCIVHCDDGGSTYCVLHRCDLTDDARGSEINDRIADIERLADDGGIVLGGLPL